MARNKEGERQKDQFEEGRDLEQAIVAFVETIRVDKLKAVA